MITTNIPTLARCRKEAKVYTEKMYPNATEYAREQLSISLAGFARLMIENHEHLRQINKEWEPL